MPLNNKTEWDAIVVGARCAGTTIATLLARQGWKVLMLDTAQRGSNKAMSTHYIRAPGIKVLERLGLGAKLATLIPRDSLRFALENVEMLVQHQAGHHGYCIRRHVIDTWMQELAEASGVTFFDKCRVTDLTYSGNKVNGVVATTKHGTENYKANWVIGADGAHSTIAKLVAASDYLAFDETERFGFFAYFKEPNEWPYEWDNTFDFEGNDFRFVFRCDDDLMLLAYGTRSSDIKRWGQFKHERYMQALASNPITAQLIDNNQPVSRLVGVAKSHFYYRKPYGKGYALVGDAGHYIHYSTGWGMSNAFCSAEKLSKALIDGRPEALEYFWRERDASTIGRHFEAMDQAKISYNNPFMRAVIKRIGETPELLERANKTTQGDLPPNQLLVPGTLTKVVLSALKQKQFDIFKEFLKAAPQAAKQSMIINRCEKRLEKSQRKLMEINLSPNFLTESATT